VFTSPLGHGTNLACPCNNNNISKARNKQMISSFTKWKKEHYITCIFVTCMSRLTRLSKGEKWLHRQMNSRNITEKVQHYFENQFPANFGKKERKGPAKFPLSCITLHLRDKIKYRHNILSGSTKEKCVTSNFRENSYTSSNLYNILAFNLDQIIEKCIIYSTK
jgi:hypothetical protein